MAHHLLQKKNKNQSPRTRIEPAFAKCEPSVLTITPINPVKCDALETLFKYGEKLPKYTMRTMWNKHVM